MPAASSEHTPLAIDTGDYPEPRPLKSWAMSAREAFTCGYRRTVTRISAGRGGVVLCLVPTAMGTLVIGAILISRAFLGASMVAALWSSSHARLEPARR